MADQAYMLKEQEQEKIHIYPPSVYSRSDRCVCLSREWPEVGRSYTGSGKRSSRTVTQEVLTEQIRAIKNPPTGPCHGTTYDTASIG